MRSRRSLLLALSLAAAAATGVAATAGAQSRLGPPPKRPKLGAIADTNDASAYLDFANRAIETSPGEAAAGFYWAARIDPGLAEAYYGRRIALLLASESMLRNYMLDRDLESKAQRALDTLQFRAVTLNPFLYRKLDLTLLTTYYRRAMENGARQYGEQANRGEIDYAIDTWLARAGPYMRGWMAYSQGNFTGALTHYAVAAKERKEKAGLRVERGRIMGMRGEADSAIAELRLALGELRSKESKNVVVLYNSKAVLEQSIGLLMEQRDSVDGAREAYGRALQEDLSYWPAHVRLGMLAITAKDTATATSELALAAQIAPDEPYVHHLVGASLAMIGKAEEALTALKKAAELEPHFALPHATIGRIYDSAGYEEEAVAAYRAFLARASRNDAQRDVVAARLAALTKGATP